MDRQALDREIRTRVIMSNNQSLDVIQFLGQHQDEIESTIRERIEQVGGIKWWIILFVKYARETSNDNGESDIQYNVAVFHSDTSTVFSTHEMDIVLQDLAAAYQQIFTLSEEFVAQGSAWKIDSIEKLEVCSVRYAPLPSGTFMELPKEIPYKSVLNIQNKSDNKCIVWSVLAQLYPSRTNSTSVFSYRVHESKLQVKGVRFPTPVADIEKIENQNNLSIHVFGFEKENGGLFPLRISRSKKDVHVNLLVLSKDIPESKQIEECDDDVAAVNHYCLIRKFNVLVRWNKKRNGKYYETRYCFSCLQPQQSEEKLQVHEEYCLKKVSQRTVFPQNENKWLHFRNVQNQLRAPFIIYADFECITEPVCNAEEISFGNYQKHKPSGYCYVVISSCESYSSGPKLYSRNTPAGYKIVECFFDALLREEKRIEEIMSKSVKLERNRRVEEEFEKQSSCHICGESFSTTGAAVPIAERKVRDHDHLSGQFRGAAHSKCNLGLRFGKRKPHSSFGIKIPVVFHNLKGYDSHILLQAYGKYKERKLFCIAQNSQKFISFSTGSLTFIDSFQFMSSSLDTLVKNLLDYGATKFKILAQEYPETANSDKVPNRLLLRKGVYPYDYISHESKLQEACLPARKDFFSILTQEECSEHDYSHAQKVWNDFKCKTIADYHDVYLKTDVLQLADVFENFRDMAMETYRLDPANYLTAPGLAWDAMLRYCIFINQLLLKC